MSMNLSFLNPLGTIGVGSGPGAIEPDDFGPAPFNYEHDESAAYYCERRSDELVLRQL